MPAFMSEPGDQQARRLFCARSGQTAWTAGFTGRLPGRDRVDAVRMEFADPWGTDEGSAAALAVTRRVGDVVMLVRIWVSDAAPAETIMLLVHQLVAVLRRSDASMVAPQSTTRPYARSSWQQGSCPCLSSWVPTPGGSSCSSEIRPRSPNVCAAPIQNYWYEIAQTAALERLGSGEREAGLSRIYAGQHARLGQTSGIALAVTCALRAPQRPST